MTVHLPDHQAAAISRRASPARPFRQGGRSLLRHPVDPVGRACASSRPCSASPWSSAPGASSASRRSAQKIADKARPRPAREPRSWPTWRAPKASRCTASCGWASSRPSPRSCCRRCCRGCASEWPNLKLFLREETSQAACDALHRGQLDCVLLALPYGCGDVDTAPLFDDRLFVAFPQRRSAAGRDGRGRRRSTRTGCCCSRTAIASRTMRCRPATGPSCAPRRR